MSFFPDSEMHKLHPQQYYDTPPTPEYTYEPSYASTVSTSESHPPIDSTFSSWESSKNRGLGLLPTKSSGPSSISNFLPQGSPTSSFVWAPFLPSQSQNQSIPEFRREMWVDTPVSSNVSNGMWSTLPLSSIEPTSGSMFDHSEYSTSCAASDYSSPYAPSALLDDNHAPRIKLESPFETSCSPKSQYEQLGSVNPMDIVTCAPPATPRMVFTPLLTPLTPLPTASQSASPQPMKLELDSEGRSPGETRNKRSYTTPEDAKCSCKQCGKLFKRASNLAAHMQTHDEQRDHPWACRYDDCDKRFNRRTDMERHTRSVHIKDMSHRCQACNRCFGRKDTLSRHQAAGCPRRKFVNVQTTKKKDIRISRRMQDQVRQPMGLSSHHYPSYAIHRRADGS